MLYLLMKVLNGRKEAWHSHIELLKSDGWALWMLFTLLSSLYFKNIPVTKARGKTYTAKKTSEVAITCSYQIFS